MEPQVNLGDGNAEFWADRGRTWEEMGATHISVNTMGAGFRGPQPHIDAIPQFGEVVNR